MTEKKGEIPKAYGMTIRYSSGRVEELELLEHSLKEMLLVRDSGGAMYNVPAPRPFVEYRTVDGTFGWQPMNDTIESVRFDERFSKIIEEKQRRDMDSALEKEKRIKVVQ